LIEKQAKEHSVNSIEQSLKQRFEAELKRFKEQNEELER
jgi:hypothetical protein